MALGKFPSPHGVISISTKVYHDGRNSSRVSVPSRGYLYIYNSTRFTAMSTLDGFRPLTGLSLYLLYAIRAKDGVWRTVSVPSRGYLYIYCFGQMTISLQFGCFRPLTGLSLYLLLDEFRREVRD